MTPPRSHPPRWAERLLVRVLPARQREEVLGDLTEEYRELRSERSPPIVALWYLLQGARVAARLAWHELRLQSSDPPGPSSTAKRKGDHRMRTLGRDLRFALRAITRQPSFAVIIVVTLALGIGANAAVFSMMDALVLNPFPIPKVDRLVMLWETVPQRGTDRGSVAPANYLDWKDQTDAFEELHGLEWWDINLTGGDEPERIQGTRVTPGALETFSVRPILGRTLRIDPPEARTAVISHRLWTRRYAGDADIIGKTMLLSGERFEIVGVAQSGFEYPYGTEVWAPLAFDPETASLRDAHYLDVIGKLAPGKSVEDAQSELDLIAERIAAEHPDTNGGRGVRAMALKEAVIDIGAPAFLLVWQATVLFVLLIACVNVANLLLARGADRQRELSLQLALGAGRARMIRQLLTENLVLAAMGAVLALPLAWIGTELIRSNLPAHIQRFVVGWDQINIDGRTLGFTATISIVTVVLFGLLPAFQATRPDLIASLRDGGREGESSHRRRGRSRLVIAEVALALTLLVAAGLSIQGTIRMIHDDQGYAPDGLMTMRISLPEAKYETEESRRQFYLEVMSGVRALAEVERADAVNVIPSSGTNTSRTLELEGYPIEKAADRPAAMYRVVTPGFFETMQIPLRAGRAFQESDREGTLPVAVVSESMARKLWPDRDPLGSRFRYFPDSDERWVTVVGVAGDVTHDWFLGGDRPIFYEPFRQRPRREMGLVVRARAEPTSVMPGIRSQMMKVDSDQPLYEVMTQRQRLAERMIGLKYAAVVMGVFGAIALALAAVGIYGLMAYSVSRRTREIGIRVALGADRSEVMRLALSTALRVTVLGIGIGLLLAFGAGRFMAASLFGVVSLDLPTYLGLAVGLAAISMLAGYFPARRAVRIDPAVALRVE